MWALTVVILFVLAISLLYWLCGGSAAKAVTSNARPYRLVTLIYVWLITVILGWMIFWFIGFEGPGTKRIPLTKQRRIVHSGYYFAREGRLVLTGKSQQEGILDKNLEKAFYEEGRSQELEVIHRLMPSDLDTSNDDTNTNKSNKKGDETIIEEGFSNPALEPGEHLILKPDWNGSTANSWTITYKANKWPLRLEEISNGRQISRCINLPDDRWLSPGDSILVSRMIGAERRFVIIRWTADSKFWGPFKRNINAYYYGAGTISQNRLNYITSPDSLMSEAVIDDGYRLSDLMRRAKPDVQKVIRQLDEDWWSVFDGITLVREIRDDLNSRIGVSIAEDVFKQPGLNIQKNYQDDSSPTLSQRTGEVSVTVPASATVTYGLGYKDSIDLKLTDHVEEDPVWNQVVYVKLEHPPSWSLPDSPTDKFIITSANDYIPLDGYFIDVGNSTHAFFAKAWLDPALDAININDGKNIQGEASGRQKTEAQSSRKFRLNEPASLGDFQQGVLLTLTPAHAASNFTGLKAIGLLVLGALFITFQTIRDRNQRPKLSMAWTLIWGLLMSILSVRLVLSYRAALVTPFDASPREIQNVFDKALTSSLTGFAIVAIIIIVLPLFVMVLRWLGDRASFRRLAGSNVAMICLALAWTFFSVAWILAGSRLGTNQTFLSARINTEVHILLVLGLVVFARKACEGSLIIRLLVLTLLVTALGVQIVWVHDAGSIIYAISLAITFWLTCFWNSSAVTSYAWRRVGGVLISVAPLIGMIILLALPRLLGVYLTDSSWLRRVSLPNVPATTFYRLISFSDSEEALLQSRVDEGKTNMNLLLNNSLQNWQMLLYGSQGGSTPAGYGRAPLSRRGMTYATSMTDCVFTVYLLAEHGKAASIVLMLLYVALGSILIFAGWHLPDDLSHRVIPLVAIGTYFSCNALYMAAANVGLTVFTGQNIPMLGLHSNGDLIQGLILLGVAGCLLLTADTDASAKSFISNHSVASWIGVSVVLGLLIWTGIVGLRLRTLGHEEKYRKDHNFSREFFKGIDKNLSAWQLDPQDKMIPKPGAITEEVERQYANQFNDRADKFNPTGGLYYLERGHNDQGQPIFLPKVNRLYFQARSPFKGPAIWNGEIVAGGGSNPSISALGGKLTISLEETGAPKSIDLTTSLPVRAPSSVLLTEGGNQFCELRRSRKNHEDLSLDPKTRSDEWTVFVDGTRVTSIIERLEPLSIVVIERKNSRFRRNLIYLGPTRPILSFVRWRNGQEHRIFPETDFPLSYLISKAMDVAVQNEKEESPEAVKLKNVSAIKLNVDESLQRDLEQILANYGRTNQNYSPYQLEPNRLGVVAIDAFSGATLAVPSWPVFDPGKTDFETLIERLPESTRSRFVYNHNLTNHVAGSTIKPVVFGAMATKLNAVGIDLARITVFNRRDPYSGKGAKHPHLQVGKIKIGLWDCNNSDPKFDMTDFLSHSRDFPEGVIGMLGMILDIKDVEKVLVPSTKPPDISYDGHNFQFDLTRTSDNATAFTLADQRAGRMPTTTGPDTINSSILYEGLASVFDFDNRQKDAEWVHLASSRFFPTLNRSQFPLEENLYIDTVLPGRMNMAGGSFQDIRGGLISCFLGGGDCGFNNVLMAQAAARLALGQRIFASLEDSPSQAPLSLPEPLSKPDWRTAHIITPMQMAGEDGTAATFKRTVKLPSDYLAIYKTGTILEGNGIRESETLMFVIGKWTNNEFVKGETVAGYLYMEKSKDKKGERGAKDTTMKKFAFATPILNQIVKFLVEKRANQKP